MRLTIQAITKGLRLLVDFLNLVKNHFCLKLKQCVKRKKKSLLFQSAEEITLIFLQLVRSLKLLNAFSCQSSNFSILLEDLHETLFKTKFSC